MDGREMCRTWLNENALFLDTETTGLDNRAEVVEIAIADSKGRPVFESLVKPTVAITPRLTDIHGISNAMVAPHQPHLFSAAQACHDVRIHQRQPGRPPWQRNAKVGKNILVITGKDMSGRNRKAA